MNILALESSCDETAAAVVADGRHMLSNVVASQVEEHKLYGGVVPEIASRRHAEAVTGVTRRALDEAGLALSDIDVPVHQLRSLIAATYLAHPDLAPPFLCLVASGGHSHLVEVEDYTRIRVLGRTRDDAAGECFDKAARAMGLPYPGGVHLDRLAADGDPGTYPLPHPRVAGSPYDFSFSGLKTAVLNLLHNAEQRGESVCLPDLAASFRKTVVDQLAGNLLRAAEDTGARTLVLAGGVSANAGLRARMEEEAARRGLTLYLPPLSLCGDNGAMVGAQAYYEYRAGARAGLDLNAAATMPIA